MAAHDGTAVSPRTGLIDHLRSVWADLDAVTSGLSPEQWESVALPGWDVKDVLAHIIGAEKMLLDGPDSMRDRVMSAGAGDLPEDRPHVRNALGKSNEEWVDHFRAFSPSEVLDEFRATTASRLEALEAMSEEEFGSASWMPSGEGTYDAFMRMRLFDCWMHDQDIRYAVGQPGFADVPAAGASLDEVVGALGFIVGKRGKAPTGSLVALELTGPLERVLLVDVADRARVVDHASRTPDVTVRLDLALFMRLAGGRVPCDQIATDVEIEGDLELGRRIAANLAFTV